MKPDEIRGNKVNLPQADGGLLKANGNNLIAAIKSAGLKPRTLLRNFAFSFTERGESARCGKINSLSEAFV